MFTNWSIIMPELKKMEITVSKDICARSIFWHNEGRMFADVLEGGCGVGRANTQEKMLSINVKESMLTMLWCQNKLK
jgi:hypothetical protein